MTRRQKARAITFGAGAALILLAWWLAGGRDGASARAVARVGDPGPGAEDTPSSGKGEFARRNPLRILREHPPPAPPPPPTPAAAEAAAPPPPPPAPDKPLPVRLVGTIAGGPLGAAMLRSLATGEEFMLVVGGDLGRYLGKEWAGTLLTEVLRNKAVVSRGGKLVTLEVDHGEASPGPVAAPPPPPGASDVEPGSLPPEPAAGSGDPAPPSGPESQHDMARTEVDENLRNLGNLITQLSVQPFFQNGQPAGFRVSRIRPGSFVDKLGAQNGDVIQDVNGKPVSTIKDAFLLYNSFKVENAVRVKVLRGGQPHVLGFSIR